MADEARLNELLDLVEQARAEGDSETEQKAIAAYKRESAPAAPPVQAIGAGGYNPMLGRLAGATQAGMGKLGVTPEMETQGFNPAGMLEPFLQAGTGAAGGIAGGLAGILQGGYNAVVPQRFEGPQAADRVRQVQGAMTYQPRTGLGAVASTMIGAPGQAYQAGTNFLGEKATDLTGSPAFGTLIKTAGDVAPMVAGARMSSAPTGPRRTGAYESTKFDVPTTQTLKTASQAAYKAADEAGVIVPVEGYAKSLGNVQTMVTKEGIDPTLHPKSVAVLKRLEEASGKPLTLQEAETLRKIALDAEDDLNPVTRQPTPDARLAGKIVDELDESIDALSVNSPARALWARSRRSQMIDRAIERAEIKAGAQYTQAGMEHALRTEFKQLALNERRMRGLTKDQQAAVRKVAAGGPLENTLRALGKFDPTSSVVAAAGSLGTSALMAPLTGGASAVLPALGFLGKRVATNMTKRNVDKAREALVGRGVEPMPSTLNVPKATPVAGELMPREPLALPAPNIISGQRSAPGTTFQREQMGMTPDVEQAGLLHPGMARESVPRRPLSLPYLPEQPKAAGPMVVDPAGRVAPTATSLDDYLRANGLDRMRNVRQPAANPPGLLEGPQSSGLLGTNRPSSRPSMEIQGDIRRLAQQVRSVLKDKPVGSPEAQLALLKLRELQLELEASQAGR
jgi:hypothetical protein